MLEIITSSSFLMMVGDTISVYMCSYMHKHLYDRRDFFIDKEYLRVLIYVVDVVWIYWLNMLHFPPANMLAGITSYFVPLVIIYHAKNLRNIGYFLLYLFGCMVSEVVMAISVGAMKNGMGMETNYEVITPAVSVCMNLWEIILVLVICKLGTKNRDGIKGQKGDKITLLLLALPLVSYLFLMAEYMSISLGLQESFNVAQFAQMAVVILLINVLVFVILEKYTSLIKRDMALSQEKLKLESDAKILEVASAAMKDRLESSERVLQQDRLMRHDRRHFEALLLSLLQEGKTDETMKYLQERLSEEPRSMKRYCDNTTINATLGYYISMAENEGIPVETSLNIPQELSVDAMELAIVLSNLVENSIHACLRVSEGERFIKISAKYKSQLLLEIENSCDEASVEFDEEGFPVSVVENHGIGTGSIRAFVEKTGSSINYKMKDSKFIVRMII